MILGLLIHSYYLFPHIIIKNGQLPLDMHLWRLEYNCLQLACPVNENVDASRWGPLLFSTNHSYIARACASAAGPWPVNWTCF